MIDDRANDLGHKTIPALTDEPDIEGAANTFDFEEGEPPSMEFVEGDILENELFDQGSIIRGVNGRLTMEVEHFLGDDIERVIRRVRQWFAQGYITSEDQITVTPTNK